MKLEENDSDDEDNQEDKPEDYKVGDIFLKEEEEKEGMEDVQITGVLPTVIQEDWEVSEHAQEQLPPEATQESFNPLPEFPTIVQNEPAKEKKSLLLMLHEVGGSSNQSCPMYPTWMLGGKMTRYLA